ncbi:iron-containing alcohol dehydrogenase [Treponema sp. OttesenSCG-928-L16]|nr:iron-containing alcohol dehydrogenase [Treponema sp. OttesenSCG-928-L16]
MKNFVFENRTKIIFGKDTEQQAGTETAAYSKRILLHHSGGHAVKSGLIDRIKEQLKAASVDWVELSGVKPNPVLSLVREGIELCRKENLGFILAVGGGSVIDSAKAIGAGVPYKGDVWDFFTVKALPAETLPVGTVLTIPAAGSEWSVSSVITNEDGLWKRGLNTPVIRPVFSILNPELSYSLPPYQTACGIADMLAHIMERYFTRVDHTELTDQLCEGAMRTIIRNARIVMEKPFDYDARAELMWAAANAHNGLLDAGRVGDWASHRIEQELSGLYDIAHGAGLAIVFPAWIQYNLKEDPAMFARFAERVWGVDGARYDALSAAKEGLSRLKNFYRFLGLPLSFADVGLPSDGIPEMARKSLAYGQLGQFKSLEIKDVEAILQMAVSGDA